MLAMRSNSGRAAVLAVLAVIAASTAAASPAAAATQYRQLNLVSDIPGVARITDPNLVNPWGLAAGPTTPLWVNDNATNVATLYTGGVNGSIPAIVPLVVSIPGGAPTGIVFNQSNDFSITDAQGTGPARFIFASESGHITAWRPTNPLQMSAVMTPAGSSTAVFKGLAIGAPNGQERLYAANFHDGTIDVFDGSFMPVSLPAGRFTDPNMPAGYAPFDIQRLAGKLYVTYAKQDSAAHDDVPGPGHGFVDIYDLSGVLLKRLVSRGNLNSPWGLVIAPSRFGSFSHDLLVGNFGDGTIHAYDPHTGAPQGTMRNEDGNPVRIDGLWGLRFGNGTFAAGNALIFSAGLADESHGLLGEITTP